LPATHSPASIQIAVDSGVQFVGHIALVRSSRCLVGASHAGASHAGAGHAGAGGAAICSSAGGVPDRVRTITVTVDSGIQLVGDIGIMWASVRGSRVAGACSHATSVGVRGGAGGRVNEWVSSVGHARRVRAVTTAGGVAVGAGSRCTGHAGHTVGSSVGAVSVSSSYGAGIITIAVDAGVELVSNVGVVRAGVCAVAAVVIRVA